MPQSPPVMERSPKRPGTPTAGAIKKIKKPDIFLDIHPREAAKQLTLIDQEMMKAVNPRDLMQLHSKGKPSPLDSISARFNEVSSWVATEVVSTPNSKQRILVVTNYIRLIEELIYLKNFHSAMSVFVGLASTPCTRLKDTWKALTKKVLDKWKELEAFLSPFSNFKKLRTAMSAATRPIIPPLTILLKDLTFMEENTDRTTDNLINFEKVYLIGQVLVDMHECGIAKYDLEVIPPIKEYLTNLHFLTEQVLDVCSRNAARMASKYSLIDEANNARKGERKRFFNF